MDIDEAPRLDLCILSPASATTEIEARLVGYRRVFELVRGEYCLK